MKWRVLCGARGAASVVAVAMFAALLCVAALAGLECTHIFSLEKDFSRLSDDAELAKHVQEVLSRLRTFKVAVHPRIRLFYRLLRRAVARYDRRTAASLYNPNTYRRQRNTQL
ncbi:uncharacterized protein LOC112056012 isoform X2 [Bicyclus anynana]|uniref:Uncharacterized protein LOC112056012 isoform X2 n=1 Tax=Bicyclus anynana TaxID=110368 RepID=A0ABM3LVF4_BICAN|nr:uncharacterized protein LOC112056012 isoform X2 [Bicyclus anynana]